MSWATVLREHRTEEGQSNSGGMLRLRSGLVFLPLTFSNIGTVRRCRRIGAKGKSSIQPGRTQTVFHSNNATGLWTIDGLVLVSSFVCLFTLPNYGLLTMQSLYHTTFTFETVLYSYMPTVLLLHTPQWMYHHIGLGGFHFTTTWGWKNPSRWHGQ